MGMGHDRLDYSFLFSLQQSAVTHRSGAQTTQKLIRRISQ
jgi:hypothetical protein